jgi:hypothetical protein
MEKYALQRRLLRTGSVNRPRAPLPGLSAVARLDPWETLVAVTRPRARSRAPGLGALAGAAAVVSYVALELGAVPREWQAETGRWWILATLFFLPAAVAVAAASAGLGRAVAG